MTASRSTVQFFKYGCLAVVALLALTVVWLATVTGSAYLAARSQEVEQRELQPAAHGAGDPGRVILDFTVGQWSVLPARPGEPLRVEAEFDTRSYELVESTERGGDERGGWTYRVTFRETGLLRDGGLRVLFGGAHPKVRVWLPTDAPLALEGRFAKGGADLELGGLWLTEVRLEAEKGSLSVGFDTPTVEPLTSLTIHGKQGGLETSYLGNASPAELEISHRMGGSEMDLRGAWVNDADVRVRSSMGGSALVIPSGVRIEGLPALLTLGSPAPGDDEPPVPTLRMSVSSSMGRMHVTEAR